MKYVFVILITTFSVYSARAETLKFDPTKMSARCVTYSNNLWSYQRLNIKFGDATISEREVGERQCEGYAAEASRTIGTAVSQKTMVAYDDATGELTVVSPKPAVNKPKTVTLKDQISCEFVTKSMMQKKVLNPSGCGKEVVVGPVRCKDELKNEVTAVVACVQNVGGSADATACYLADGKEVAQNTPATGDDSAKATN